jgi:hypothetical protein
MNTFYKVVALLALGLLATFYRLFVFTKVWALTIVPLGAPHIGLLQAFGVSLAVAMFTPVDSKQEPTKKKMQDAASGLLSITLLWGIAALVF